MIDSSTAERASQVEPQKTINTNEGEGNKKTDEFYPPLMLKKYLLPKWCHGMVFALVLMCLAIIGQGMVVTGQLPITITMLEKNFGFTSVQTGLFHSYYDIFFIFGAYSVGVMARKRKLFFVGVSVFIIAVGSLLFSLPHFLYNYAGHDLNNSSTTYDQVEYGQCDANRNNQKTTTLSNNMGYYMIFAISYSLIGFGAAPMHTSALTYFDENLTPQMNGLYLGIYYLFGSIGPAAAFGLGKVFLSIPVNLKYDPNSIITPKSESWIGAWWLGYILIGVFMVIVSILLMLYPSRISRTKNNNENNSNKTSISPSSDSQSKLKKTNKTLAIHQVFNSIKILFKNTPYVLAVLGMSIKGMTTGGLGVFLSKFFEVQFRVSSTEATVLAGILVILGAGLGCLCGGLIMKKKGLTIKKSVLIVCCINFTATLLCAALLFGCDTRNLGSIALDERLQLTDNTTRCQAFCNCRLDRYEPVCDESTQITHISPCLAGCRRNYSQNGKLHFTECECLDSLEAVVSQGGCVAPCDQLYKFMVIGFLTLFSNFLAFVPEVSIVLQLLPSESKNLGIASQQLFTRIGFMVGPLLYGYLIDRTCILWSKDVHNSGVSYCLEYNNEKMRFNISICSISIELTSALFYLTTFLILRHSTKKRVSNNAGKVNLTQPK